MPLASIRLCVTVVVEGVLEIGGYSERGVPGELPESPAAFGRSFLAVMTDGIRESTQHQHRTKPKLFEHVSPLLSVRRILTPPATVPEALALSGGTGLGAADGVVAETASFCICFFMPSKCRS